MTVYDLTRSQLDSLKQAYIFETDPAPSWGDLAAAASLITGQEYRAATLRGCVQGECQNIVCPAAWGRDSLEAFEAEYFNTGTEWEVHDGKADPTHPADVEGYNVYCTSYTPREELAAVIGCAPGDLVLWEFSGWERRAEYREVE